MRRVGQWILAALKTADNDAQLSRIRSEIREFCAGFPVPGIA
jgi:glycine/serine hydroxymethyltransferase